MKLNSKEYWDERFDSGDWRRNGGEQQTLEFSKSQAKFLTSLSNCGSLLDFGCGTGDAFPTYRSIFPRAKLFGVDHSSAALEIARQRYGDIAEFFCSIGEIGQRFDYIICSNVLEHVDNPETVANELLGYVDRALAIVTPYRERPLDLEHVHTFSEYSFASLQPSRFHIFKSNGWTEYGGSLLLHVYIKNIGRLLRGEPTRRRRLQIMYIVPSVSNTRNNQSQVRHG